MIKYTEKDIDRLAGLIREFKAGAIDTYLNKHINKCVEQIKEEKEKENKKGFFSRIFG
jgi:hypothetical protein